MNTTNGSTAEIFQSNQDIKTKRGSKSVWQKNQILPKLYFIVILVVFLFLWQVLANRGIINTFHFGSPTLVAEELFRLFQTGEVWPHMGYTMYAALIGLLLGVFFGVVIAFIFGTFKTLSKIFDPLFVGLNGLPKLALGPLLMMWFGIGLKMKIFMAAITVFFLVFFNAYAGFRSVDGNLTNTLKLMGASKWQIILKVTLPSSVPWILASLRGGVGAAVMGAILGEYLGSSKGLGWMVQAAGGVYNTPRVLAVILILMVIMCILDYLVKQLEQSMLKWRGDEPI